MRKFILKNKYLPSILTGGLFLVLGASINIKTVAFLCSADREITSLFFKSIIFTVQITLFIFGFNILTKKNLKQLKLGLLNILLCMLSLLITFIAAEVFLRIMDQKYISEHARLFRYEKELGWEFIPNSRVRGAEIADNGYNGMVAINSEGFRDQERKVFKPAGKKRIAMLGDSFVSNVDVKAGQVFTAVMENELLPPNLEVLNFGVNGYGPVQELLLLKSRVMDYHPDIVVAVIYIRNDFYDISGKYGWIEGYQSPKAQISSEGDMRILPAEPRQINKASGIKINSPVFGLGNSRFLSLIYSRVKRSYLLYNAFRNPPEMGLFLKHVNRENDQDFVMMSRILKEMRDTSLANNAQFVLVVMPTIYQVADEKTWKKLLKEWHLLPENYDRMLPNTFLEKIAGQLGVKFLDLTSVFKGDPKSFSEYYYVKNQHLNNKGNRLVAGAISRYLAENNLL